MFSYQYFFVCRFSAQDGLFLASFLSVTICVAIVLKLVCQRYCGVRCAHCAHKQDPNVDVSVAIDIPMVLDHHSNDSTSLQEHQQTPSQVQEQCSSDVFQTFNNAPTSRGVPVRSTAGKSFRELPKPVKPSMQTVFEEDETEVLQHHSSLQSLNSNSSSDVGVVYTIYAFPLNNSPEVDQANLLSTSVDPIHVHNNNSFSNCKSSTTDLPPSYDDLFPIKEESDVSSSDDNVEKYSSSQKSADVNIEIEASMP